MIKIKAFTEYGISVKVRLMRLGYTQNRLINELHKKLPDRYIDSSYLNRLFRGEFKSPEVTDAIEEIINMKQTSERSGTVSAERK